MRKHAASDSLACLCGLDRGRLVQPNPAVTPPHQSHCSQLPISSDSSGDYMAGTRTRIGIRTTRIRIHRSTRADKRADVPCD
jgi:hypothetical protein